MMLGSDSSGQATKVLALSSSSVLGERLQRGASRTLVVLSQWFRFHLSHIVESRRGDEVLVGGVPRLRRAGGGAGPMARSGDPSGWLEPREQRE